MSAATVRVRPPAGRDGPISKGWVRKGLVVVSAAAVSSVLLVGALRAFGGNTVGFAFAVVWIPMTGLGTVTHWVRLRLPDRCHALRRFERNGRIYERLGIRLAKRLLRRGPFARFNPGLRLPAERTPASLMRLDDRMRGAEASHVLLFVLTLALVVAMALRGWRLAASATLCFDVLVNAYPAMLQRYNRSLLTRVPSAPTAS